ncbi:MAG TPA: tetratricopeptide repeat protein [Gallionellaceae bacterium]
MSHSRLSLMALATLLVSCTTVSDKGSIGQLKDVKIELTDAKIEGGLEKAMQSYQKFLEQTPESAMTPEALRRLADLKIQKEYGTLEGATKIEKRGSIEESRKIERPAGFDAPRAASVAEAPAAAEAAPPVVAAKGGKKNKGKAGAKESGEDFEKRATEAAAIKSTTPAAPLAAPDGSGADLQSAGALEAIAMYKKLLDKYPNYERNDQVLYQLSRAYEEIGQTDEAMKIMDRIVKDYPASRYFDEVQFRRGEYFFTRKKFLDAEDAYTSIVKMGPGSSYYELAMYKLGWTFYKQELYEESLHRFVGLLDYKIKTGYDFEHPKGTSDEKRIEDTYRVVSLAFSNLGGADAVVAYFNKYGKRSYEVNIYSNLGEYYLDKRRYSDAATTFKAFVKSNPYHKVAPHFDTRVIEIYKKGGFPQLVIDANKEFVVAYGLKSEYWKHFDIKQFPEVVGYVKTSLKDLANHYHSLYQEKKFEKDKPQNFQEAMKWYRDFLASFPKEPESPAVNFQLSELLLENKSYAEAAIEYEHTAYDYPYHEKAPEAGYAAVYAHRENLAIAEPDAKDKIKRDVIRSSLKFADTFPQHEKAALVMGAAVDDIYAMKDYAFAVKSGRKLLNNFPRADQGIIRSSWLVVAHASFDLGNFKDAEEGYFNVLQLTAENDKSRPDLVENYAASIYKQGELANKQSDFKTAAEHFLRVAKAAPTCSIRATADYDGATALIQLKDWDRAADVLTSFRSNYVGHKLQPEVTEKIAYVYKEAGKLAMAAAEYERIETESQDVAVRREALQTAASLYVEAKDTDKAMQVYRRYVNYFPKPLEPALETRNKIANVLKARNDTNGYMDELKQIVAADARAGAERTDRTRYLGATASLALTVPLFDDFVQIKLAKPFDKNLQKKKVAMKSAKDGLEKLLSYEVGDVTAAATYYIAEMYYNFSRALMESERPDDLSAMEKEQYELALEDQAFPFEEKAIQIHEKNLELLSVGVFSSWIDSSIEKLAKLVPARYAKFEESSGYVATIDKANYAELTHPAPILVKVEPAPAPAPVQQTADAEPGAASAPEAASAPVAAQPVAAPEPTPVAQPAPAKKTAKPKKGKAK